MKQIRLENMELQNFKGVQHQAYAFNERTAITGANGTGKSTIFDAYLWCLFDKTQHGEKPKVQPLDPLNEIIPDLTTEVTIGMTIDGNAIKVARRMVAKKDGGTESKYFVNDVPMTQSQFKAKMSEICDLDRWFTISSVNIIPAMDQKVCRAALQDIAPEFDENAIMEKYPAVKKAYAQGLTIDELAKRTKADHVKAKEELDAIPAMLAAQDRLRVEDDFTTIAKRIDEINGEVRKVTAEIDEAKKVKVDTESLAKLEERKKRIAEAGKTMAEISSRIQAEYTSAAHERQSKIDQLQKELDRTVVEVKALDAKLPALQEMLKKQVAETDRIREEWKAKNAEEYVIPEYVKVCPTCGQTIPEDRIEEFASKHRDDWDRTKAETLQALSAQGKHSKGIAEKIQSDIDAIMTDIKDHLEYRDDLENKLMNYSASSIKALDDRYAEDAAYNEAEALYNSLMEEMEKEVNANKSDEESITAKVQPLKDKIAELMEERNGLDRRLAAKETNERIDKERERLHMQELELAQTIANYAKIEKQIADFRKEKIEAVEESVSSLFRMVHWKMYEANVTNDGEKEICQPIIFGVPFQQQNTATQINAALDIVNGFAKAYEVSVPLFIDGAESVTHLIQTDNQLITLAVKDGAELEIA